MASFTVRSVLFVLGTATIAAASDQLKPISYNNPGLVVDLGVGLWAWPLPMDYDRDGDLDLVVSCPDKPYNGVYLFENPGESSDSQPSTRNSQLPVFKPARRLGHAVKNIQISYVDGDIRLLAPGVEYRNFREQTWDGSVKLPIHPKLNTPFKRTRANQWKSVDYDGDGDQDLIVGLGVWDDYGWDDAWDASGNWTNGPLHGYVYFVENEGSQNSESGSVTGGSLPNYADPVQLTTAEGNPIDVYGMPSPNLDDFDGDGDLDLICGEFLDGFTYFENTGTRADPEFSTGRRLQGSDGNEVRMDLQMITPVAVDWDQDGDVDLVCGDEDGRVALIEHTGELLQGMPQFNQPVYFQQEAAEVKFGALVTPVSVDWDEDEDEDLVCGNTAGYVGWFENLDGGDPPTWGPPKYLSAEGEPRRRTCRLSYSDGIIRQLAGPNGSIQGPCEAKWGYTTLAAADWDHDGSLDIVQNGIWGFVDWFSRQSNSGLSYQSGVSVRWNGDPARPDWTWWAPTETELVTQWRTTPLVIDFTDDGLNDLVMLDHEGYLALYERTADRNSSRLLPPRRIFKTEGPCEFDSRHRPVGDKTDGLLRLNANRAGASGRRKLCFADWDGDGRLDLLVNSVNVNWLRNVRTDDEGFTWFKDMGQLDDRVLAGHTTSPTVVDWDRNGIPDLLVGAEDGRLYYKKNPRAELAATGPEGASSKTQPVSTLAKSQGAVLVDEIIFEDAPFPSCHASTIEETPSGLVAAWFGGTHEKHPDVGIWVARKVDDGWSDPVEVADGVQHADLRYPTWNPVLYQAPGQGPLLLFYKVGPNPREWWGMLTTSRDGGRTWSVPFRLPEQIDGPVRCKPVILPNDTLLCGSSTEYDGWRVHFEITTDTLNWKRIGPINDASRFNAIQPTILVHRSGNSADERSTDDGAAPPVLQALCRTQEQVIVSTKSTDLGKTWSPLKPIGLPNPNAGIDGVTLEDGRHLLVYNHTTRSSNPRGRAMLNVALSENGEDWQAAAILEREPGAEFSYPAVIQSGDGLVHITYTWKRERIKHVVLDPEKLTLTPILDGTWPSDSAAGGRK